MSIPGSPAPNRAGRRSIVSWTTRVSGASTHPGVEIRSIRSVHKTPTARPRGIRGIGVQFISYQENIDTTSPLGQALFTIISAVAQLERDLIRERVRAGLRNARAKGKKFGRPRAQVDAVRVAELRRDGLSWSQVCRTLSVSKGSALRSVTRLGLQISATMRLTTG